MFCMRLRFAAALITSLFAAACAGDTSQDQVLTHASSESVVVFGLEPEGKHLPDQFIMAFRKFDPATKQILANEDTIYVRDRESAGEMMTSLLLGSSRLSTAIRRKPSDAQGETDYRVVSFQPGTYALVYVHIQGTSGTNRDTLICLTKATPTFEVAPGKAIYLGNMMLSEWGKFETRPKNLDAAKGVLASQYQNVAVPLEEADTTVSSLEPKEGKRGNSDTCSGYGPVLPSQSIRYVL